MTDMVHRALRRKLAAAEAVGDMERADLIRGRMGEAEDVPENAPADVPVVEPPAPDIEEDVEEEVEVTVEAGE